MSDTINQLLLVVASGKFSIHIRSIIPFNSTTFHALRFVTSNASTSHFLVVYCASWRIMSFNLSFVLVPYMYKNRWCISYTMYNKHKIFSCLSTQSYSLINNKQIRFAVLDSSNIKTKVHHLIYINFQNAPEKKHKNSLYILIM